ncbi:hypothetical protein CCACVL1_02936 [Corchorus capsularis]|uniref:Uncharacterized protein n=1 Tax=Corchorus capsularis TaxID=210143 RepID=A0A1R3K4M5_COCAP|nr:hypothetical protein CCACVL1_02936 [Corchorus capsularis]
MVQKLPKQALLKEDPSEFDTSLEEDPYEHDDSDPTYHPEFDDDSPTMSINKAFKDHIMDDKNEASTSSVKESNYDPMMLKFMCICEAIKAAQHNLNRLTKFMDELFK